ncbi:MAG: extracellular solute-binding protein [Chloroflexota bacterium]|nr:extracellular solute-binding protein [Chloroflexota bacterium]
MRGQVGGRVRGWARASHTSRRALLGGGLFLAGCAPFAGGAERPPPSASERPATIQFWPTWGAEFQVSGMTQVAQAFQAQAPQLTVELTPYRGEYEKIVAAVAAGAPPDVHSLPSGQVGPFARRGLVESIEARVAKSQVAKRDLFLPAQLEVGSWNGKLVALPCWEHAPSAYVFWNQGHFAEAGLPDRAPATLDEARLYAERLTKFGDDGAIVRLGFDPLAEAASGLLDYWANAYDVSWYDKGTQKVDLLKPGLIAAVEYIQGLYRFAGYDRIQAYRQRYPAFNAPAAGMPQGVESIKISSGVSVGTLALNAPAVPVGIGWAPAPARPRTFITLGGGHYMAVARGAPQPDAAWRFLEYLTSGAAGQQMFDRIGWISYNKEVARTVDVRRVPNARFAFDAPAKAQQVLAPVVLPVEAAVVGQGVQRVLRGEQSAREMLQQAGRELQGALDEARRGA